MKNILIFYASYGGGHLAAAKSLKECIDNNFDDINAEMIDCMQYVNRAINKVTTVAYKEMAKNFPWAWGRVYSDSQKGPIAHITSNSNKVLAVKLLRLLREKKPDIIISTHPFASQMCSYLKRKEKITAKIATIMTDFAPHDQWLVGSDFTDYFFVAHEGMKNSLIQKDICPDKIFATGIPLSSRFLKTYNREEILKSLDFSDSKKTVLFFGGGEFGLGKSNTLRVLESFLRDFSDIQIIAISGKNQKMKKSFEELSIQYQKQDCVKIFEFTNMIPEYMSISDIVVTKPGGLTSTESLASDLPILIMNPIPGQEDENAEFLEKNKVGILLKKDSDVKSIIFKLLFDENVSKEFKENASKIANRNSTQDICKILLK